MKCFKYSNRAKSYITVSPIDDPYGDGSGRVISIGCTLKGDTQNPTWKVHVPLDLAEGVAQEIIRLCQLSRKNSSTEKRRNYTTMFDDNGNIIQQQATNSVTPIDMEAASKNAVTMGRVIKRQK